MSDNSHVTYRVVFWGDVVAGLSRRDVALKFARQFRIRSVKQLQRIFSGRLLTLKRQLSEAQAQRFCQVLSDLGALCRMEREVDAGWHKVEPDEDRPRHTASIRFDLLGLTALDFTDPAPPAATASAAQFSHNPFAARDPVEPVHPPVRYYDGRPVK